MLWEERARRMQTSEKSCVVCGGPLPRWASKLCSKKCRDKRRRAQIARWFSRHRSEMRSYWARYHAEHREARNVASRAAYYRRKG